MKATPEFEQHVTRASPIIATAVHDGHCVRPAIAAALKLSEEDRLREEDPFTGEIARLAPSWLVVNRSRFEIDLNRPRDEAFYRVPEDAWGLEIWNRTPSPSMQRSSLSEYDRFYRAVHQLLTEQLTQHPKLVVLDLHAYNHRRHGPLGPRADTSSNPEINIGTGTMNRTYWGSLVDRFIHDLSEFPVENRTLDVRENVKFRGRQFPQWIHTTFPNQVCAIAVEFKKTYMDEWTGRVNRPHLDLLSQALRGTFPGLCESLAAMNADERSLTSRNRITTRTTSFS